ncbi:hypothetical protein SARC_05039 [Sphaeroforma arctica JP610]|uniref:Uncharacterized protein n=1 Tax=Sphaeroforma arctica JP610 TaxID=667725 RepID=A0A0L0G0U1_9EUKA|nr:hypothetical protein SARC_05039 [Sphaeroforma arctica JP610]KNC82680.1 hypothetical protein SARC_05039 [Sphaeroforma arctica JP610]|eukprot:XP_014156582.1 hypothetical protein SARC_05039 [Sphaeroforma arctica JP610]
MAQLISKVSVSRTLDTFNKQRSLDVPVSLTSLGSPGSFSFDELQFCSTCLGLDMVNDAASAPNRVTEVKRIEYIMKTDVMDVVKSTEAPLWVSIERSRPSLSTNESYQNYISGSRSEDVFSQTSTVKRSGTKRLKQIFSASLTSKHSKGK